MHLYRVHPWREDAGETEPFGALYVPPLQGYGRWDNPDLYRLRYFSLTPAGAVAETFGSLRQWSSGMFLVPGDSTAVRAVSTYSLPDETRWADLADPPVLTRLGVGRVTDVTRRDLRRTQRLAERIHASGEWDGIAWWSYCHPEIELVATWVDRDLECRATESLAITDDVVAEVAELIVRSMR
ncbi:RES family NAD+ phosphorylase [Cellulosimicrobium funkei]|nr:RES family NAD+ phosphorylase [Cellulosimicrobium funkei]